MDTADLEDKTSILGPLVFSTNSTRGSFPIFEREKIIDVKCLLCSKIYKFYSEKDDYLAHLYLEHKLIISDVGLIAILDEYLEYWQHKLTDETLKEFCTTMLLDQLPDGTVAKNEEYFLLGDILPEDKCLRNRLQEKRLNAILSYHEFERSDQNYLRECLHCRDMVGPSRSAYIEHLTHKHYLQLGNPNNLVMIDELVDVLQEKIEQLVCLFCDKVFRDRTTLKEHMRKKGHKRINPLNKDFDKYFLINYSNDQVSEKNIQRENRRKYMRKYKTFDKNCDKPTLAASSRQITQLLPSKVFQTDDSDSDWSDWKGDHQMFTCLYCRESTKLLPDIFTHMTDKHHFDFNQQTNNLDFYQKVKIVNYIRRKIYTNHCPECHEKFDIPDLLMEHLQQNKHFHIGNRTFWDMPEYFFPTYEDDAFLCYLDDSKDEQLTSCEGEQNVVILPEDTNLQLNKDALALSKENFENLFG